MNYRIHLLGKLGYVLHNEDNDGGICVCWAASVLPQIAHYYSGILTKYL